MKAKACLEMDGSTTVIINPKGGERKTFTFDHSYWWDTPQPKVYADLGAPILQKAFDGYNGTIFAYGQTGSGKSWSMMGGDTPELKGIIPIMNESLFKKIGEDNATDSNTQYLCTVSYLEIYNETIHDLLNPSGADLKIREHPQLGMYGLCSLVDVGTSEA